MLKQEWIAVSIDNHQLWLKTRFSQHVKGSRFEVPIDADLTGANLAGANLYGANLAGANLYGANLTRANLTRANLTRANLYGANLTRANLYGANLYGANLTRANLTDANLYGANLYGANLTRANLPGVIGNRREIISIQSLKYPIAYTHDRIQIGCKNFAIDEWWAFADNEIKTMDYGALDWWLIHKPILQLWIAANPANCTTIEAGVVAS